MSKILITGAGGFIGSYLVETLVKDGHDVKAMVRYKSDNSIGWLSELDKNLKNNLELCKGDVIDSHLINHISKDCEIIINLAALVGIPYSYEAPNNYVNTNILGCSNLLNASLDNGVKRYIQISTSEVFGSALIKPMNEDHPKNAQSPYAATKTAADQLSLSYYRSFGMPVTVIRPFNTFGPRQSFRAVIPTIAQQISHGYKDIKLGNINTTRDFSYVTDTVNGIAAAVTATDAIDGQEINLGTGVEYSIKDIVSLFAEIAGREVNIITTKERMRPKKSEVMQLISDNTKAKQLLGWSPEFSDRSMFKEGLERVMNWMEQRQQTSSSDHYVI